MLCGVNMETESGKSNFLLYVPLILLVLFSIFVSLYVIYVEYNSSYIFSFQTVSSVKLPLTVSLDKGNLEDLLKELEKVGVILSPSDYVGHLISIFAAILTSITILFMVVGVISYKSIQFDLKKEIESHLSSEVRNLIKNDPKCAEELWKGMKGKIDDQISNSQDIESVVANYVNKLDRDRLQKKITQITEKEEEENFVNAKVLRGKDGNKR